MRFQLKDRTNPCADSAAELRKHQPVTHQMNTAFARTQPPFEDQARVVRNSSRKGLHRNRISFAGKL